MKKLTYLYCMGLLAQERNEIDKRLDILTNKCVKLEKISLDSELLRIHIEMTELLKRRSDLTYQMSMLESSASE